MNAAEFDIYIMTETRLNDSVFSCSLFPPNDYDVYRCDRSSNTSTKESGGGALIGVHKKLKSELVLSAEPEGCEQIWIKIKNNNKIFLLGALYIPPSSCSAVYHRHLNVVKKVCENVNSETTVILYGDFNLPSLKWIASDIFENSYIPINVTNEVEQITIESCNDLGLHQMNNVLNDNCRILDLFWINEPDICVCRKCDNNILYNEVHHKALKIEVEFTYFIKDDIHKEYFMDFSNANYDKINDHLNSIDWRLIFNNKNTLESKVDKFYEIVNNTIKKNVQMKEVKKSSHPIWFDSTAINLKNRINKFHKKYKKFQSSELHDQYVEEKRKFVQHTRQLYKDYKINMQQLISEDPKQFFKHVNLSRKYCDDLPTTMSFKDKLADNPNEIADLFRQFFQSVYATTDPDYVNKFNDYYNHNNNMNKLTNVCQQVSNIEFDEKDILECINELPDNMVMGPDNIPNRFIKKCIQSLAKPIYTLLKESFRHGVIPQIWKQSYIRPIYKSGKKSQIDNYRGVAIQCTIPKILDSLIAKHLNRHLKTILTHHQHGFVSGKSTVTNLAEFTYMIMNSLSTHKQIEAIYLDLCKAFDSVIVALLIHKLRIMGMNQQIMNWIAEYFNGRQQLVRVGSNTTSSPINVTSGVGQGYPISSSLFNLFLFDLPFFVNNASISLFADDAKLFMPVNNENDCKILQNELNIVNEYFKINCMKLNEKKTKMITFHRCHLPIKFNYFLNDSPIERVDVIKDLGILLDEKLTYKCHINFIVSKAKSILAWIKRYSYEFDDPWIVKRLFETFVLPIIEYASHIWSPSVKSDIIRIESIQKQFLLFALRKFQWKDRFRLPSYKNRLLFFHMNTLEDRRKIYQIVFIFSLLTDKVSSPNLLSNINIRIPQRATRNYLLLSDDKNKYDNPFSLMKKLFNAIFSTKNKKNEFDFDLNQNVKTIKSKLKIYFELNVN